MDAGSGWERARRDRCGGKCAVVIDNFDMAYHAPRPLTRLVGQRGVDAVANAFVNPAKRRVQRALDAAGYLTKTYRWSESEDPAALEQKLADYLDWMTVHRGCVRGWIDWGHGSAEGTLRVFGRDLTGGQLLGTSAPKSLDVIVLGACFSNRAGFQPYGRTTVGYWSDTSDLDSGALGFAARACNAIGGRPVSRATRWDSGDQSGPRPRGHRAR